MCKKLRLPNRVQKIMGLLNEAGYESYVVGGCVRDSLMGITPLDWDITTNANTLEVKRIMEEACIRTLDTGIEYGTITALIGQTGYEITTYREDVGSRDGRRPQSVNFTSSLKTDVMRRDLTINGIAYNQKEGLVDYVGGIDDIKNRRIKFIGDVNCRLEEDVLRALRAIRFKCRFGFKMDDYELLRCLEVFQKDYIKISPNRFMMELTKLFSSEFTDVEDALLVMQLLAATAIPEIQPMFGCTQNNAHHLYDVATHTAHVMVGCSREHSPELMFAALLHDIGKPVVKVVYDDGTEHFIGHPVVSTQLADVIMDRFKPSNAFKSTVLFLVEHHDDFNQSFKRMAVKRFMGQTSKTNLELWKVLRYSDVMGQRWVASKVDRLKDGLKLMGEIEREGEALRISDLKISGTDILELGLVDKRKTKDIQLELLEFCLSNSKLNTRDWLLDRASKLVAIKNRER